MTQFTESVVEDAALDWLECLGFAVKYGPETAPGELAAERADYGQVVQYPSERPLSRGVSAA